MTFSFFKDTSIHFFSQQSVAYINVFLFFHISNLLSSLILLFLLTLLAPIPDKKEPATHSV